MILVQQVERAVTREILREPLEKGCQSELLERVGKEPLEGGHSGARSLRHLADGSLTALYITALSGACEALRHLPRHIHGRAQDV